MRSSRADPMNRVTTNGATMNGGHDLGGMHGFGRINAEPAPRPGEVSECQRDEYERHDKPERPRPAPPSSHAAVPARVRPNARDLKHRPTPRLHLHESMLQTPRAVGNSRPKLDSRFSAPFSGAASGRTSLPGDQPGGEGHESDCDHGVADRPREHSCCSRTAFRRQCQRVRSRQRRL